MRVEISYDISVKKVYDMTPKEYCDLRARMSNTEYYPEDSFDKDIKIADEASEKELLHFFYRYKE